MQNYLAYTYPEVENDFVNENFRIFTTKHLMLTMKILCFGATCRSIYLAMKIHNCITVNVKFQHLNVLINTKMSCCRSQWHQKT